MKFHALARADQPLALPLLFGHFVPWYTLEAGAFPPPPTTGMSFIPTIEDFRHWQDARSAYRRTHLHWPEIGRYDSRDPRVIHWQIESALACGVEGFILNWYGKHSVENLITLHWLDGLRQWNDQHPERLFHYFFSLDSQAQRPSEGKQPVSMEEDFAYLREHLMGATYLCRDGRPVFSVFPYENNCPEWRSNLDAVFGKDQADLIWMNGFPGKGENAAYPWICPDGSALGQGRQYPWIDPDNAGEEFLRHFYHSASSKPVDYLMGGVWPGFDDQLVSWAWNATPENPEVRPRVMCRETSRGNTLDLTWKVLLEHIARWAAGDPAARRPCPLIQIVTWNDYAEATTVEPTRDYGRTPLEQCQRHLAEARRLWREPPAAQPS